MAAYTPFEPSWKSVGGYSGIPSIVQYQPQPGAVWRTGDFLANTTTGTITYPTPVGAMIAVAGPSLGTTPGPFNILTSSTSITQGVVTVTATTSAGAPAAQYFCQVAYSNGVTVAATSQSLASAGFIINCPAGLLPAVSVSATGAPGSSGSFLLFLSTIPNTFWFQAGAAQGSTAAPANPLTNSVGAAKAAVAASTGIIGMADSTSDVSFFSGEGGGPQVGVRNVFGPSQSAPPGWDSFALKLPVVKCQVGYFELNLIQAWNGQLFAAVGLNIDATTGYFVADTTQTQCATIVDKPMGPTLGDVGDTYARVTIQFLASALS